MSLRSRFSTWWKAVTRANQLDSEIEEELAFHIETRAEDLMRNGLPREEALRQARVELGGLSAQKENCRSAWGTRAWDELCSDLRYGCRMLIRSPGFTAIAIGSLALGIGANTIIFTLAKQVMLDRLSVKHPEQLRLFGWWQNEKNGAVHWEWGTDMNTPTGKAIGTSFSYPIYQLMKQQNHSLVDLFAFKNFGRTTATIDGQSETVEAELVSGNYYNALGVKPELGRGILDSDDGSAGSSPVAVISDSLWTRRFGRSPSVIGKTIELNLVPVTIVGVNPPSFTGTESVQSSPDVFCPFSMQPIAFQRYGASLLTSADDWWVVVMGRIKPGTNEAAVRASFDVVLSNAVRATMTLKKDATMPRFDWVDGSRGLNDMGRQFSKPIYVLLALTGFVLLLACANLANLLLARSSARQREMSVRLALGAGRARILRQMLTESLLLSILGGIGGLLLGYLGRNVIPDLLSSSWSTTKITNHLDWQIFGYTTAISIFTGLLFGMAPAWQGARTEASSAMKESAQSITHRRRGFTGKAIVVLQISLSVILVVGAGLFTRTLVNLSKVHLGFNPENILLFDIQQPNTRYPAPKDIELHHELEERLSQIPGVDSLTLSQATLISGARWTYDFTPSGRSAKNDTKASANFNAVGAHFFSTFGIPVLAGRGFTDNDTPTSKKVAIVNQQLVKKFFPGANPIGKTFTSGIPHSQPTEIVGIVADTKYTNVRQDPPATFYEPYSQQDNLESGVTYEVHTRMNATTAIPMLRSAVQSVDKSLPLMDIRTQQEQIDDSTRQERVFAALSGGFGVLAVILACIGIYGIMAYTVSRRTNEIGIRMALGAQAGQVLRMVLGEASWLAVVGVLAGLGIAAAMGRLVTSMLFGLTSWDPLTLATAALLLVCVALGASWIPARRAAHIDPIKALRHE
jgi:predicted permease